MAKRRDFGTIRERKGSRQLYVRFHAGKGRNRKAYDRPAGVSREIAKAKLRHVQRLLEEGKAVELVLHEVFGDPLPHSMTFEQAIDPFLEHVQRRRKPSTHAGYRHLLGVVKGASWAKKDLTTIEPADIVRWLDGREQKGLADQTLNNYAVAISGLFRWAMERGHIQDNPARRIRWRPQGPGRETYLTAREARALVRAASPEFRPLLVCALSTGMRRGELLTLRWREVDLEAGTVAVAAEEAKNHRRRTIPMTPTLQAELAKLAVARPARQRRPGHFVVARPDGRPLSAFMVASRLRAAVKACKEIPAEKKPKVTMHTLRHTAASLMVAGGRTIFDVANILGHQDVKTSQRYAHFAPEAGRATIETLGRMLDLDADEETEGDDAQEDAVHDQRVAYGSS